MTASTKAVWAEWRLPSMTGGGLATGQPGLCRSAP
jgi:hypothetical protein